ncbi:hypothetical protein [Virgibacillus doumboii]|uniref:hypothetical protein n=1 Tax=Virgibacillus doumboii TaxID=2697503 RepID=UPI0013DFD7CA|nr:hypothetical protein [Virgibacillus doumboii]
MLKGYRCLAILVLLLFISISSVNAETSKSKDADAGVQYRSGNGTSDRITWFNPIVGSGFADYHASWQYLVSYSWRTEMDIHETRVSYDFVTPYSGTLMYSHRFTDSITGNQVGYYNHNRYDGRYFTDWILPGKDYYSASSYHNIVVTSSSAYIKDYFLAQAYVNKDGGSLITGSDDYTSNIIY